MEAIEYIKIIQNQGKFTRSDLIKEGMTYGSIETITQFLSKLGFLKKSGSEFTVLIKLPKSVKFSDLKIMQGAVLTDTVIPLLNIVRSLETEITEKDLMDLFKKDNLVIYTGYKGNPYNKNEAFSDPARAIRALVRFGVISEVSSKGNIYLKYNKEKDVFNFR